MSQCIVAAEPFAYIQLQHEVAAEPFEGVDDVHAIVVAVPDPAQHQLAEVSQHHVAMDRKLRALQARLRRKDEKIRYLQHQLAIARAGPGAAAFSSKRCRQMCTGMLLALLRGSGHASARQVIAMGSALMQCSTSVMKTRQTLTSWEIASATAILSSSCDFHRDMETSMQAAADTCWVAVGHVVMGDATRGKAWREEKLQPMCLISWYSSDQSVPDITSHTCWPDVQLVRGEDAKSNFERMHKQLRIVQCCCFDPHAASTLKPKQVRFIWLCGDNGGDQKAYRPLVAMLYRDHLNVMVLGMPCLSHQYSLICCRQLACLDVAAVELYGLRYKYYAALVKISNLLRSRPIDVRKACVNFCKGDPAHPFSKWGKTKCPRCIAGRWGSVAEVDQHLLGINHDISTAMSLSEFFDAVVNVLQVVWVDDHKGSVQKRTPAAQPEDEDAIDECAALIAKRGRWFRQSYHALTDTTFRRVMHISHECKSPLTRFLYFLQKKYEDSSSHLQRLVYGKGDEIVAAMEEKHFASAEWFMRKCDDESCDEYCAMISLLMLMEACEFDWRIMSIIKTFPAQMCWFVKMPPHVDCPRRRDASRQLLDAQADRLDASSLKILSLMRDELVAMRDTGRMDIHLHTCFKGVFESASVSIQCIESTNKTVCHIGQISSSIEAPLLAARRFVVRLLIPAMSWLCIRIVYKITGVPAITHSHGTLVAGFMLMSPLVVLSSISRRLSTSNLSSWMHLLIHLAQLALNLPLCTKSGRMLAICLLAPAYLTMSRRPCCLPLHGMDLSGAERSLLVFALASFSVVSTSHPRRDDGQANLPFLLQRPCG